MAFRRSSNFRRRSGNYRSRSRGLHKRVLPTQKYQAAQFHVFSTHTLAGGGNGEVVRMIHLASIAQSLQLNQTDPHGTVMGAYTRALDIGGIVFDYGFSSLSPVSSTDTIFDGAFLEHWSLVSDRLVKGQGSDVAVPSCIDAWSPFAVQWPVAVLGGSSLSDIGEQYRHPIRVHWQKTHYHSTTAPFMLGPEDETIYFAPETNTLPRNATVNRRLRLRLDDQQGLFLTLATRNGSGFSAQPEQRDYIFWVKGTLYYRIVR